MLERDEQSKLSTIRVGIDVLEVALQQFEVKIGPPLFIAEEESPRFKYPSPTSAIFQVVKAARVVSGLDAASVLLAHGHVTEMGVLFRTINDFLADILYMQEVHEKGSATVDQQRVIDQFFAQEVFDVNAVLKDPKQPPRVSRKSILASGARLLQSENPDPVRRMAATLDIAYSMYVHGEYPTIMEMYVGGDQGEGFRVRGMVGTPKIPIYRQTLAFFTHQALNVFAGVALGTFGLHGLWGTLLEARRQLEASDAYKTP
jgi:hypothetical protein